jgi:hypothetical protein
LIAQISLELRVSAVVTSGLQCNSLVYPHNDTKCALFCY